MAEHCDHGITFDEEEAKRILRETKEQPSGDAALDFVMGPTNATAQIKKRARTEKTAMPSEKMRTRAREWLYAADHPNEAPSAQEVDFLATLLDEVCVSNELFQKSLALAAALDVPREVVPADITTLIEQRDKAWLALDQVRRVVSDLQSKWCSEEGRASLSLIASELDNGS